MRRQIFLPALFIAIAVGAGCGTADNSLDPPIEELEQEVVTSEPPCTGETKELLFKDSTQVCAGPWEYRKSKPLVNDPFCGPLRCPNNNWNVCKVGPPLETLPQEQSWNLDDEMFEPNGDGHPTHWEPDTTRANILCNNYFVARKQTIPAASNPVLKPGSRSLVASAGARQHSHRFTCRFVIQYDNRIADPSCNCAVAQDYPSCSVPDSPWLLSAPGLARSALDGAITTNETANYLGKYYTATNSAGTEDESDLPVCTSGEGMANPQGATAADLRLAVQRKYDFIRNYETKVAAASRAPLQKNQKLIYELWGEYLNQNQRASARALYKLAPAQNHACAARVAPPPVPPGCTEPHQPDLLDELLRCQRLLENRSVTAANASLEIYNCTNVLKGFGDLGLTSQEQVCDGETNRIVARDTMIGLLQKNFDMIETGEIDLGLATRPNLGEMLRQLYLIDAWYEQDERNEYIHGDGVVLEQHLSYVMGRFWKAATVSARFAGTLKTCGTPATSECLAANAVGQAVEDAVKIASARARTLGQSLISVMFTTPTAPIVIEPAGDNLPAITVSIDRPPLRGLGMLMLLGDVLTPLTQDLNGLIPYHDMACLFRDCRNGNVDTPSSRLWNILAHLENPTALATAVTTGRPLSGWQATFKTVSDHQSVLATAIAAAVPNGTLGNAKVDDVPVPARGLWRIITQAAATDGRFRATGLFKASADDVMYTSLLEQERSQVVSAINTKLNKLTSTVTTYKSDLRSLVSQQLGAMENGTTTARLETQWKNLSRGLDERQLAINTLQLSRQAEDEAESSMLSKVGDLKDQFDHNTFLPEGNSSTFPASGQLAKFVSDRDPGAVAFRKLSDVPAGRMLQVSASGQWMPTCSLLAKKLSNPNGVSLADVDLSDATIGPEGYSLRLDGTHAYGHTSTRSDSTDIKVGVNGRACYNSAPRWA